MTTYRGFELDLQNLGPAPETETCDLCEGEAHVYTFDGLDGYFNACNVHVGQRAVDVADMVGLLPKDP